MIFVERKADIGYLDSVLWVPKTLINVDGVKRALTFTFAEHDGDIRVLSLWKETQHHLLLPREFWKPEELAFPVVDMRPTPPSVSIPSHITLDFLSPNETTQRDAVAALEKVEGGILQLACGLGKSVIALEFASRMSTPTLIIVDNTHLLGQWKTMILGDANKKPLLGLAESKIGLIQGEVFDWRKPIVLATYQTLANLASSFPEEVRRWFGLIVWDEAHHVSAPTFSRTADLFYGYRLGLTATPTREDGSHVIYELHIGPVVYKDLRQELKPRICFKWTGLSLDMHNPNTARSACDKNGELHLSKLSTFFGQWQERLDLILTELRNLTGEGRKVLVLSNSVDELINLLTLWTGYGKKYTDIPFPTERDVGETVPPMSLEPSRARSIAKLLGHTRAQLREPGINTLKRQNLLLKEAELKHALDMNRVAKLVELERNKKQRAFLKALLEHAATTNAGLMIHKVKPKERAEMLRTKQIVFAIAKYGREGLDEQALDTVLVCEPFSSKNTLQQVMGRALRKKVGKKDPLIIFLEDDIGPIRGMCGKLRKALREWAVEDGGPFQYELLDFPVATRSKNWKTQTLRVPGQ